MLGFREIGPLTHYWWGCKMLQPLWKTIWQFLIKLSMQLPNDPAALHSWGFIPEKLNLSSPKNLNTIVHSSFIQNSPKLELAQVTFMK